MNQNTDAKLSVPDLERKLRSIGIVKWDKEEKLSKVLGKAITIITRQLQLPGIGIYRRENLIKLRAEFQKHLSPVRMRIVQGGLPGLGKKR